MNLLSGNSLAKAKTLIDQSGAKKNSISLLMELGQLLHSSPTIEVYEHQTLSSVHQHVFVCDVKFFQYSVEAVGYNKKKLKGDAATAMVDKLYNAMDANEEASKLNEQQQPIVVARRNIVPQASAKPSVLGTSNKDNWKQTCSLSPTTTLQKSETLKNRLGIRALNHHLQRLGSQPEQSVDTAATERPVWSELKGSDFIDKFGKLDVAKSQSIDGVTTALERLKILAQEEKFNTKFYDVESSDAVHLCLVEARMCSVFVCHGMGDSEPQAREDAAENLLSVIKIFQEKERSN